MQVRNLVAFFITLLLLTSAYLPLTDPANAQSGQSRKLERKKKQEAAQQGKEEVIDADKGDTIKIEANLINLEVTVFDKKTGGIYQGLKPGNFLIYEDGVKQDITNFAPTEAPITLVLLLEFSRQISFIRGEVINPAAAFVTQFVRPKDQIAIVAYDLRPAVLNDFTDSPSQLSQSIGILIRNVPALNESNLFDALNFVLRGGKLEDVEYGGIAELQGRAAILLISSGLDTFSKINYDKALKIVESSGVPIYSIGIGNLFFKLNESRLSDEARLTFLQSSNQLRFFSEVSGGRFFPVTFQGEIPSTLKSISALLRSQYSIGYNTTNSRREGKRRKIEVKVDVDGDGQEDNKKLVISHRKSYIEPKD